ncbi:MAG: 50S ribosomal protein L10 [Erysipelotrichales bacterium]|nr:50S ribosomal protein L10 [Erysipelotrichales bacterium]
MNKEVLTLKEQTVSEITEKFKNSGSAVVVEYRGLSVAEVTELRRNLRAENVDYKVYKNTLSSRAAEAAGYSELTNSLTGPNAIAFSEDAVAPARILAKFAKTHDKLVIKAGIVEGSVLDAAAVNDIAKLPNRDGMISMLLGCFQAPVRDFACVIKAVADSKEA